MRRAPRPVANQVSSPFALEGATGHDAARAPKGRRAEVAQLVEHGSEKPGVPSSILGLGTIPLSRTLTREQVAIAVDSFRLQAHPTRVRLLRALLQDEPPLGAAPG